MQFHPAGELPRKQAADALVVRCLLHQEAQPLQISAAPSQIGPGRYEAEEKEQTRMLLGREVSVPEVDLDTCRQFYEVNSENFGTRILVYTLK